MYAHLLSALFLIATQCLTPTSGFTTSTSTSPSASTKSFQRTLALPNQVQPSKKQMSQSQSRNSRVVLNLNFGDFGKFFNLNPNEDEGRNNKNTYDDDDDDDDDDYIEAANIFSIRVKSLKVGGCRLYLSLYLIGEANNPERGTWRMDQTGEGGIDLYHRDATGALMIRFKDDEIIVNRFGSSPSMTYLMNESQILNMMLDQLDEIAFDASIDEKDRLICLHEPGDAINVVRESLSFT